MKAPGTAYDDPVLGKDPQPATMQNYDQTPDDNYGVHINSGIPNHAFTSLRRSWADTPGRKLGASGTKHCVIHAYDQPPAFDHSLI